MSKLSIKKELAINKLLKGNIGVSKAKLNRWLANNEFKDVLNERKRLIVDNCLDKIKLHGNEAIIVLKRICLILKQ